MLAKEQLDELRTKYKRICHITVDDVEFVLRAPTRAEYRQCRAAMHDPMKAPEAQEDLCVMTVVYPDRAAFDAILESYPGLCENKRVSDEISYFTGMKARDDRKSSGTSAKPSGGDPT